MTPQDRILGGLWGAAAGDALGVPVEFLSRPDVRRDPVTGMRGPGTHGQPPGTWSDDTSLSLCTAESLLRCTFDPADMGRTFCRWHRESHWTPRGWVFDIGVATAAALSRIARGLEAEHAGGMGDYDNGNGSLMRILPVALRFAAEPVPDLLEKIHRASSLTHGHPRSQMACGFYALIVRGLLAGQEKDAALCEARRLFEEYYTGASWWQELSRFTPLLSGEIAALPEEHIRSGGYVMETLLASVWCLLTTESFSDCVLCAVNLGSDTDTTGCVAGGLAGVLYGVEAIPPEWRNALARAEDLDALFRQFEECCSNSRSPAGS